MSNDIEHRSFWEQPPLPVYELIFTDDTEITHISLIEVNSLTGLIGQT